MSPIRPLFRNDGLSDATPQCHGVFKEWIGDPKRGKDTTPLDVKLGTLCTEILKRPDGLGLRLVGRPIPKAESVPGIIAQARVRRNLLDKEVEFLRRFLIDTIARETYSLWLSTSGLAHFFYEDDWTDQENHRKFALYVLACFVDFFRPGQVDWRTHNSNDMQLVAKLLKIFADTTHVEKQRKLIRCLFNLEENLKGLAVETSTGLSREDRNLLIDCRRRRLKGEARARWLQKQGFKGFGKSALTKYRENPDSMRAQISAWTSEILEQ